MVIESAVIAPVLALMALGAFDVSALVARQSELQSATAEAAAIALAAKPDTTEKMNAIKSVLQTSGRLKSTELTVATVFRCGTTTNYVNLPSLCTNGSEIEKFLQISINTSYTPQWTQFGVGHAIRLRLVRTVQWG